MKQQSKNLLRHPHARLCALILSLGLGGLFLLPQAGASKAEHAHGKEEHGKEAHGKQEHAKEEAGKPHAHGKDEHDKDKHGKEEEHKEDRDGHADEGEVQINARQSQAAALQIERAGPGAVQNLLPLPAEIRLDEARTAHLSARLPGVLQSVHVELGQKVRKGQLLAVLHSPSAVEVQGEWRLTQQRLQLAQQNYARESMLRRENISAEQDYQQAAHARREAELLAANARQKMQALGLRPENDGQRIELRAPQDGMVLERHATPGEAVKEEQNLFTIADLSQVWAELEAPARDMALLKQGAPVRVTAADASLQASGVLDWIGVQLREQNRSVKARVRLANPALAWRPGLLAQVEIGSGAQNAALTVAADAVQEIAGKPSVFVRSAKGFRAQTVQTGRSDGRRTEILAGLQAGTEYVASGSFVLKSELGKNAAAHSH